MFFVALPKPFIKKDESFPVGAEVARAPSEEARGD